MRKDDQAEKKAASARAKPVKKAKTVAASAKAKPVKTPKKAAASPKPKVVTAAKKAAAKSRASKGKTKCVPVKQHRIRIDESDGRSDAGAKMEAERDPFEVAKQTMKGSVPAIVQAMVELAKQGSCSHAKTLLEMTGAKHMFDNEAEMQGSGEPWAKLVLQRLDEAEGKAEREAVSLQEGLAELVAER